MSSLNSIVLTVCVDDNVSVNPVAIAVITESPNHVLFHVTSPVYVFIVFPADIESKSNEYVIVFAFTEFAIYFFLDDPIYLVENSPNTNIGYSNVGSIIDIGGSFGIYGIVIIGFGIDHL